MLKTIGARLAGLLVVLFVVSVIVFLLLYISGGDVAQVLLGDGATPDQVAALRSAMGLDRPILVQYIEWLGGVLHGDLGESYYRNAPVAEIIVSRIEPTVSIAVFAQLIAIAIAIPLGIASARRVNTPVDGVVTVFSMVFMAVPGFVFALLLALSFGLNLRWFPVSGYSPLSDGVGDWLRYLILPAVALGIVHSALLTRMTRSSMLDVLSQDYIRTARSKGATMTRVVYGHALKNASFPILTIAGLGFASLITGALVTETIFNIPGLGQLLVESIARRDLPVIQGVVLLITTTYIIINLIVDMLYVVIDPRLSKQG